MVLQVALGSSASAKEAAWEGSLLCKVSGENHRMEGQWNGKNQLNVYVAGIGFLMTPRYRLPSP